MQEHGAELLASIDMHRFGIELVLTHLLACRSATDALRMVGETFPWSGAGSSSSRTSSSSQFVYTSSNHNSVLGIGSYALAAGAELQLIPNGAAMESWIQQQSTAGASPKVQHQQQHSLLQWSSGRYAPHGTSFDVFQGPLIDDSEHRTVDSTSQEQQQQHMNGGPVKAGRKQLQSQQQEGKSAPRIRMPQNEYYRHRHLLKRAPWDPNMTETKPPIYNISETMGLPGYGSYSSSSTGGHPWLMNALPEQDNAWSPAAAAWSPTAAPSAWPEDDIAIPISSIPMAPVNAKSAIRYNLVAYPAEDNYAGVIYPLEWINQVSEEGGKLHATCGIWCECG